MIEGDCGKDIPDPGCEIRSCGVGGNRTNGEMTEIGGEVIEAGQTRKGKSMPLRIRKGRSYCVQSKSMVASVEEDR